MAVVCHDNTLEACIVTFHPVLANQSCTSIYPEYCHVMISVEAEDVLTPKLKSNIPVILKSGISVFRYLHVESVSHILDSAYPLY